MKHKFLGLIEDSIRKNWVLPALTDYEGATIFYKDFALHIARLHAYFRAGGVQKGDKIAICGRNSSHWAISFFGTLTYGAVAVSILHEFDKSSVEYIVNHSDAKVFFVDKALYQNLDSETMPKLETVVVLDDFSIEHTKSDELKEFFANAESYFKNNFTKDFTANDIDFHKEDEEELAVLNYTSGTTSSPKGVMIPYRSLWSNTKFANDNLEFIKSGDNIVCILPMAHTYGLAFEILNSLSMGCHIHFLNKTPSPKIIMETFAKIKPKLVLAVPLIIEKIVTRNVFTEIHKQPVKTLIKIPFLNILIRKKIKKSLINFFGGNLVEVVIGGAALNKEVERFLRFIHFPYTVGYGMTECSPLIAYAYWTEFKKQSCGRVVDRMEAKIDSPNPQKEVGEILVKGTNVMLGYYKNEEASQQIMLADGWMRTGDLGILDKDNFLFIKGRNKNLILGASGQNIYPEEIEDKLNNSAYIQESLVIEEDRKVIALIYPDAEAMKQNKVDPKDYTTFFDKEVKQINETLPSYSKIKLYRIQETEFDKTPKRSIRRFKYQ